MKDGDKRECTIEKKEIERFCQDTEKVLKKIHDRVDGEQAKTQREKKKTTVLIASE